MCSYRFWTRSLPALFLLLSALPAQAQTTMRVSLTSGGQEVGDLSAGSSISANGRVVAFISYASNLVPGDTNGQRDIFVRDLQTRQTTRVSVASDGTEGNSYSYGQGISADGRFVSFQSLSSNLVPDDTNGVVDVFVHDRLTGQTRRVSVASDGTQGNRLSGGSFSPGMSADGRFVAFESSATNLVPGDTNGRTDIFVHDLVTRQTERVSVSSLGVQANDVNEECAMSADGRFVAFYSWANNLVPGDTNSRGDAFVHDRQTGQTTRVSVTSTGAQASAGGWLLAISANGRFVAFESSASVLMPDGTSPWGQIFVHDRETGRTECASVAADGSIGTYDSDMPSLSGDGRFVTFSSRAANLVPGDTNGLSDVFVHDRITGHTERVSVAHDGSQGSGESFNQSDISADGRFVVFRSNAGNLVPDDTNGAPDVFVRDLGVSAAGALHHFDIAAIPSPQSAGAPFSITVVARDVDGNLVDFNGPLRLNASVGEISPIVVDLFGGAATFSGTLDTAGLGVALSAWGGGAAGTSNAFDVNGGPAATGILAGVVQDLEGTPAAGATVTLNGPASQDTTTTDAAGMYSFSGKPGGHYRATAEAADGKRSEPRSVTMQPGSTVSLTLVIKPPVCNTTGVTPILLVPGILGSSLPVWWIYPQLPARPIEWDGFSWGERGDWGFRPVGLHDPFGAAGWLDLEREIRGTNTAYMPGCTLFEVPWDWRLPVDKAVERFLVPAIERAKEVAQRDRVHIVAHSMGGLLARAYIQGPAYAARGDVAKLAMVGTPNRGSLNAYFLWQGGDPQHADFLGFLLGGNPVTSKFYTKASELLFESLLGRPPGVVEPNGEVDAVRYQIDLSYIYHTQVGSIRQLQPTWSALDPNGALQCPPLGTVRWTNDWLTDLDADPDRFRLVSATGALTQVRTKVFAGIGEKTLGTIPVRERACSANRYPDGAPRNDYIPEEGDGRVTTGDGTVPVESAFGGLLTDPGALGNQVSFLSAEKGAHSDLIGAFRQEIAAFLLADEPTPSLPSAPALPVNQGPASMLTLAILGRPQPHLVAPGGEASGVDPGSGSIVTAIPASSVVAGTDFASLRMKDPADGVYTLSLSGTSSRDYRLQIAYVEGSTYEAAEARGYFRPGHGSLAFTLDRGSTPKLRLTHAPIPPSGLRADAVTDGAALLTRLSWVPHSDPDVTSYGIYAKYEGEPALAEVGASSIPTFDPGDRWADGSTAARRIYAVTARHADGAESLLSDLVLNDDQDHDGVPDAEEATAGTQIGNPDSDGDGLSEGWEALHGTNPLLGDTDGDGYSDGREVAKGSDPLSDRSDPSKLPLAFYTVAPCRILDTRQTTPLVSETAGTFQVTGKCNIPVSAVAVSANVTVVQPTGIGYLTLYSGLIRPLSSTINFSVGQVRSNNAILPLAAGDAGALKIFPYIGGGGTVNVVLDVNGYFE